MLHVTCMTYITLMPVSVSVFCWKKVESYVEVTGTEMSIIMYLLEPETSFTIFTCEVRALKNIKWDKKWSVGSGKEPKVFP